MNRRARRKPRWSSSPQSEDGGQADSFAAAFQVDAFRDDAVDRPNDAPRDFSDKTPDRAPAHLRRKTLELRADLHCHSNASSGPAAAFLGLIGCPECYSEPEAVYDQARARGMDLIALTDHDSIAGATHLVNRGFPDIIVGQEVTVYFPEDRCKLHVLVWNLTPELHEEIGSLGLRSDVYLFASWLRDRNLPHALAHPLYIQNRRLTRWHVERCALLFKGFEVLNGAHTGAHRAVLENFLDSLSPGKIHRLITRHGLEPLWPRIWEKARTAGSDDHGLLNIGRTWTAVPFDDAGDDSNNARNPREPKEFLRRVMAGHARAGGVAGHSALLAHQLTTVGAHYFARVVVPRIRPRARYAASKFLRFAGIDVARPSPISLLADTIRRRLQGKRRENPLIDALRQNLPAVLASFPMIADRLEPANRADGSALSCHDDMADFFEQLHGAVTRSIVKGAAAAAHARDRDAAREHALALLAAQAAQIPYLFSLFHQNKERTFLDRFARETSYETDLMPADDPSLATRNAIDERREHAAHASNANLTGSGQRPLRVALFTDTLADVNGVSRFIQNCAEQARLRNLDFKALTSTRLPCPNHPNIVNFAPIAAMPMPKYANLEVALPPLLSMLRYIDRAQPDVIHVSTPGPVGCAGLLAARMLRCPVAGVYHTDFPAYMDHLFDDAGVTWSTAQGMKFFYSHFARIFTRSAEYADSLTRLGIKPDRLVRLFPGIDIDAFHVRHADRSIWPRLGLRPESVKVLYAGRVSVEKNLPALVSIWKQARARLTRDGIDAQLVVIGDGPFRDAMQRALANDDAHFLGFKHGTELSTLYASGDLFVFPSLTDTLGQVVMEAQASGMPVIVSNQGGPKEVVQHGRTGFIVDADKINDWAAAIVNLAGDAKKRRAMGEVAAAEMQNYSIAKSFDHYWNVHEQVRREHAERIGAASPITRTPSPSSSTPVGG